MKTKIMFMMMLILQAVIAHAEYWSCEKRNSQAPVITNTPAVSPDNTCKPLALDRSPYNKVSETAFRGFAPELSSTIPSDSQPPRHRLSEGVETSLKFRHVASRRAGGSEICEVSGEARAKEAGEALVTVTRGAVTKDSMRVRLWSKSRPMKWQMRLAGKCREPEVEIKRVFSGS